jgi:hypothetical protein
MQIGGGGLKACPESPFDTFTKLKAEKGKWKVNYTLCRSERSEEPSSKANLLQDFSRFFGLHPQKDRYRHTVLDTVSQMFVAHSPLQGRGQGEGSSRRVKSCNELFNFSTLQLLNFKEGGKLCCQ